MKSSLIKLPYKGLNASSSQSTYFRAQQAVAEWSCTCPHKYEYSPQECALCSLGCRL